MSREDTNTSPLPPAYDPTEAEGKWYPIWEDAGYFTPEAAHGSEPYCIVIPPPNVTGSLHMGHALTVTIEDALIRWRRMQGYKSLWVPGTDHAGIATQTIVERTLQANEGIDRHTLGREAFLQRIWEWKEKHGDRISEQLRVLGCSVDWTRERFTMDSGLSRAVREVFVRLYKEGLIYRARKLINWCPRCQTALSDLEVEHEENHPGELWSFAYPLAEREGELVVATTRPETMLGDTAVAVHPDDDRHAHLIGTHVKHPLLDYRIPIVGDSILVDPEFGTGAVKVTPGHDFNDFETGQRHNLALFNILERDAQIAATPEINDDALRDQVNMQAWQEFAGLDRFAARKRVKERIAALGLERDRKDHVLSLGRCQRCATPVEPTLSVQWFVKAEPLAAAPLEAVRSGRTRIIPEMWTKTYYHWMENIQDWCISRQLWWGHRIPAWYGPDREIFVAHSEEQAHAAAAAHYGESVQLEQDEDVLDTWFSSALWPFSTLGWPDDTEDLRTFYPNAVMETGFDILFFWVARMMMMGCKFMGEPPFPIVYLHAMVRDKHGEKMSKTKGNVIDPLQLVQGCPPEDVSPQFKNEYPDGFPAFGADALRFTLAAMSATGRDIKLSVERIAGYRAFANKIWNATRFALMRLDGRPAHPATLRESLEPADRFILSRLAVTVTQTNAALEAFRFADAAQSIYSFIWDEFCDWYIELVKPRLQGDDASSRDAAHATLVFTLDQSMRLLHPFMPFITEEIWQKLPLADVSRDAESIMLAAYPSKLEDTWRNVTYESAYALLQSAVVGIRNVRTESNVAPSKWVDAQLLVDDAEDRQLLQAHSQEVKALARVQTLDITTADASKPDHAGVKVLERLTVAVPLAGLVDFAAEAERLRKSIAKTRAEHDKLSKKLQNPKFLERAPADVVQKDRDRATELESMLTSMQENLQRVEAAAASQS